MRCSDLIMDIIMDIMDMIMVMIWAFKVAALAAT